MITTHRECNLHTPHGAGSYCNIQSWLFLGLTCNTNCQCNASIKDLSLGTSSPAWLNPLTSGGTGHQDHGLSHCVCPCFALLCLAHMSDRSWTWMSSLSHAPLVIQGAWSSSFGS